MKNEETDGRFRGSKRKRNHARDHPKVQISCRLDIVVMEESVLIKC